MGEGTGSTSGDALNRTNSDMMPRIRSIEEVEALIERLNRNLNERMANRENIMDSVSTLRRMRVARALYLRQRSYQLRE
jgi:hypothetical protein